MLVLFLSFTILIYFNNKSKPILLSYVKEKVILKSKVIITDTVKQSFIDKELNYNDFLITSENSAGEIISIDFDNEKINKILIDITNGLVVDLKQVEKNSFLNNKEVYYIPFGIITGLPTSNWIGPQIPVKTTTVGSISSNVNTSVKTYGINSLMLQMNIIISVNTRILLPFVTERITTTVEVPVITKIIQGKIPQFYGGSYNTGSNIYSQDVE